MHYVWLSLIGFGLYIAGIFSAELIKTWCNNLLIKMQAWVNKKM